LEPQTTITNRNLRSVCASESATSIQRVLAAVALSNHDSKKSLDTLRETIKAATIRPANDESLIALFFSIINFCRIITNDPKIELSQEIKIETISDCLVQYNFIFDHYTSDDGLLQVREWPPVFFSEDPLFKIKEQLGGVPDLLTNILFIRTTAELIKVGGIFKLNIASLIEGNELMIYCFNEKYWNKNTGSYQRDSWLADSPDPFFHLTGLLPLYAKIPTQEMAEAILEHLLHPRYLENEGQSAYLCAAWLEPNQEQKAGPILPLFNWLLAIGLRNYDFVVTADQVKSETLDLIRKHGHHAAFTNTGEIWPGENMESSSETVAIEKLFTQYLRH